MQLINILWKNTFWIITVKYPFILNVILGFSTISIKRTSVLLDLILIEIFLYLFSVHSQKMTKWSITFWHHLYSQSLVSINLIKFIDSPIRTSRNLTIKMTYSHCNILCLWLIFTALALASFECEAPEKSYEKEKHKQLKWVNV